MTLAEIPLYRMEYCRYPGHGYMLSLVDKATGQAKSIAGRRVVGECRSCLKSAGPEEVIRVYLRMMRAIEWRVMYKKGALL